MERPTTKSNYTKQELVEYARWRKEKEFVEMQHIREEVEAENSTIESIDQHEEYREPLEITVSHSIKIGLSWGGDADGFILEYDQNKELVGGKYYWADWGVYEEVELSNSEADEIEDYYLFGDGKTIIENQE